MATGRRSREGSLTLVDDLVVRYYLQLPVYLLRALAHRSTLERTTINQQVAQAMEFYLRSQGVNLEDYRFKYQRPSRPAPTSSTSDKPNTKTKRKGQFRRPVGLAQPPAILTQAGASKGGPFPAGGTRGLPRALWAAMTEEQRAAVPEHWRPQSE